MLHKRRCHSQGNYWRQKASPLSVQVTKFEHFQLSRLCLAKIPYMTNRWRDHPQQRQVAVVIVHSSFLKKKKKYQQPLVIYRALPAKLAI